MKFDIKKIAFALCLSTSVCALSLPMDQDQDNPKLSKQEVTDIVEEVTDPIEKAVETMMQLLPEEHKTTDIKKLVSETFGTNLSGSDGWRDRILKKLENVDEKNRLCVLLRLKSIAELENKPVSSIGSFSVNYSKEFNHLYKLDSDEWTKLVQSAEPFFKKEGDILEDRLNLIRLIYSLNLQNKAWVIDKAREFIGYGEARDILDIIRFSPQSAVNEKYFSFFMSLLKDQYDDLRSNEKRWKTFSDLGWDPYENIVHAIRDIPKEYVADAVWRIVNYMSKIAMLYSQKTITDLNDEPLVVYRSMLENHETFAENDANDVFAKAEDFIKESTSLLHFSDYLAFISMIPQEHRTHDNLEHIPTLLPYLGSNLKIMRAMLEIPMHDRADVFNKAKPFLKGNYPSDYAAMLRIISLIPPTQRENQEALGKVIALLKKFEDPTSQRYKLMDFLQEADPEHLLDVVTKAEPFIGDKHRHFIEIIRILETIESIPFEHRDLETIKHAINFVDIKKSYVELGAVLKMLPPSMRIDLIKEKLLSAKKISDYTTGFLLEKLTEEPKLKSEIFEYWKHVFNKHPNKHYVSFVANFAIDNLSELGLAQNHGVAQQAIRAAIVTANDKDPKNPYAFQKKLLSKRMKKIDWSKVKPLEEFVDGYVVAFNPEFFNKMMPRFISFDKLPPYDRELFDRMIEDLGRRVQCSGLSKYIKEITGLDYGFLTAKSNELSGTYMYRGEDTEQVSLHQIRLIELINYINSLSDKLEDNALLSEREETLVRSLSEIQGCSTGVEEGVAAAYMYRVPSTKSVTSGIESYQGKLISIMRREVEKGLTGKASHDDLYIKNVIGHEVGLGDQVSFDSNSQSISQILIAASKQQMIENFFAGFKPSNIISAIGTFGSLENDDTIRYLAGMGVIKIIKEPKKD